MKEGQPVALLRACVENTGVLVSIREWFESERAKILEQCANATVDEEIYRLQGEARCLRRLHVLIAQMTKAKGEFSDQPRNGRVRSIVS
jgi:hypothetical protein